MFSLQMRRKKFKMNHRKKEDQKRTSYIRALVTIDEHKKIKDLADSNGEDVSAYIRNSIRFRNQSRLSELLAMSQDEKSKGNFDQLTLEPILDSLESIQDQINGLDENKEKEFYWELLEWLKDFMKDSRKRNLFNEHSYEIPDDHE